MRYTAHRAARRFHAGFTAIELMIVLAAAALLLGVAMPGVSSMLHEKRLNTATSELYGSLNLARNSAIGRGATVSICPSTDGKRCADSGKPWADGWIVFEDPDRNGRAGDDETILRHVSAFHDRIEILPPGSNLRRVSFHATGDARGSMGEFRICHRNTLAGSRIVALTAVGRVSVQDLEQAACKARS